MLRRGTPPKVLALTRPPQCPSLSNLREVREPLLTNIWPRQKRERGAGNCLKSYCPVWRLRISHWWGKGRGRDEVSPASDRRSLEGCEHRGDGRTRLSPPLEDPTEGKLQTGIPLENAGSVRLEFLGEFFCTPLLQRKREARIPASSAWRDRGQDKDSGFLLTFAVIDFFFFSVIETERLDSYLSGVWFRF